MSTKEALNAAADYIEQNGWFQDEPADAGDGTACAIWALDEVAGGFYNDARNALVNHLGLRELRLSVIQWNDAPGRTKEEVIAAFRAAAEAVPA